MSAARIEQLLIDRADALYQSAQGLAPTVMQGVEALLASLTDGGKVLVAASGAAAGLAQVYVHHWLGRLERDRPGLPAVLLPTDDAAARHLQALGHPGDVLLLLADASTRDAHADLIDTAHAQDMTVVMLAPGQATPSASAAPPSALRDTDVWIAIEPSGAARVLETQLAVLHCLCDGVDAHLLGDPEN